MIRIVHIALIVIATTGVAAAQIVPEPAQPVPSPTQPEPALGEPAPGEPAPGDPASPAGDGTSDGTGTGEAELVPDAMPSDAPSSSLIAQPPTPPSGDWALGVDALFMMPFGDYSAGIEAGFGALARFEYRITPLVMLTARAGGLFHLLEDNAADPDLDASIRMLLVYAGARVNFGYNPRDTIFAFGELGLNHVRISVDLREMSTRDNANKPSLNVGAGFQYGHITLRGSAFVTPRVASDDEQGGETWFGLIGSIGVAFHNL